MTEECCRGASGNDSFRRRVVVFLFRLRVARFLGRRHQQSRNVHDAFEFADAVEEAKHGVVRPIELHFERHLGKEFAVRDGLRCVAANLDSRLVSFSRQHAHEVVDFFLVRHDAPLDFELLFEADQLPFDLSQLRTVSFQLGVLPQFAVELGLRRRIRFAL